LASTLFVGFWLARTFHKALQKTDGGSCSLKLLQKAIVATFFVHFVGSAYILGLTIAGILPWHELGGWLFHLSLQKAPWDLVAIIALLSLVRQIRLALWLILY
jgi:hypothetical protein